MRDILTILAGLVIAVLVALLAVPPLVDWTAHRALVDRAIARAVGSEARTEGALDIRLLPSPRIRIGRLRLGSGRPDAASLDAIFVKAELALTPLLAGDVRFLDTRIGRAEIKLPTGAGGDWRVPRRLTEDATLRRAWAFEDLSIQQFLVTTVDPGTGRTDQGYAEDVRLQAGSLAGPWRMAGSVDGIPVELALGEIGPDLRATLKASVAGGGLPRLDLDGRLDLVPGTADDLVPEVTGQARFVSSSGAASSASPPALRAQAALKARGRTVELSDLAVEAGEGVRGLRLTGQGRGRIDEPRLSLDLAGRRADLSGALAAGLSPADLLSRFRLYRPPFPLDLSLRLDALGIGADEDLAGLKLQATSEGDVLRVSSLEATGPGRSSLRAHAEIGLGDEPTASGRAAVEAADGDRFARLLRSLGFDRAASLVGGRPVEASADVAVVAPITSLRNLRVALGETVVTGTVRYAAGESGTRPRLDAQLAAQAVDVAALPEGGSLLALARDLDLGLTLDARGVAYGAARGGRISGRVATDGASLLVERLEVRDLAGAEADLSGRIAPDGTGRIEGRLRASRAAPLLDLFGRAWIGGLSRLIPDVVRDSPVDLQVQSERAAQAGAQPGFRTALTGRLAGGVFAGAALTSGGLLRELEVTSTTERGDLWWPGRDAAGLRGPARLSIRAVRAPDGPLAVTGGGIAGGARATIGQALRLGPGDDRVDSGEFDVTADDGGPLLRALGLAGPGAVPLALRATLSRSGDLRASLSGQVAGSTLSAEFGGPSLEALDGRAEIDRLSLPWLASALALGPPGPPSATAIWPAGRFAERPALPVGGRIRVSTRDLALGGGLAGTDATLTLATRPDGFEVTGLDARMGGGRLRGAFTLDRQGGLASLIGQGSVEGWELPRVIGAPVSGGTLTARLRFGASGESLAGIVANLGGAGDVTLEGLRIEAADPGAAERVAARILRSDDPLATRQWQALLPEELGRGPLTADRLAGAGSLVGGAFRIGPLAIEGEAGGWQGNATLDLKGLTFDARGTLQARAGPPGWTGPPPAFGLGWSGAPGRLARLIDPAPLVNGLAGAVLARELDRIDTFDRDAGERQRRNSQAEMDRQRRRDAEESRQARLREEAAERAREVERQRQDRERARAPDPPPPAPVELRPSLPTGAEGG